MKINKKAMRKELDLAADELERVGYHDLAIKVDQRNQQLMKASAEDVSKIRRALSKIQTEAERREKVAGREEPSDSEKKASHATQRARRTSERRQVVLARRLKESEALRKKAEREVARLRKLHDADDLDADIDDDVADYDPRDRNRQARLKRLREYADTV